MKVKELIRELENYDDDTEVVIKVSNSMYVDSIEEINEDEVRAFYGDDYFSIVLYGGQQVGAV